VVEAVVVLLKQEEIQQHLLVQEAVVMEQLHQFQEVQHLMLAEVVEQLSLLNQMELHKED
jgi:hypothetical protein